jgi:fluoride exporter
VITAVLVALCCGLGAVARFAVDGIIESRRLSEFPFGTLVVNLSGSFLLGLVAGATLSHRAALIVGTATIGSYTTFSTWMLEIHRPAEDGERSIASNNFVVSLLAGFAAVAAGKALGGLL